MLVTTVFPMNRLLIFHDWSAELCSQPLSRAQSDAGAAVGGGERRTQIFEHSFDTLDGTEADPSLSAAEKAELAAQQEEEARKAREAAEADRVNDTPGEKYHVICSLGAGLYTQWQSRVVSRGRARQGAAACPAAAPTSAAGHWPFEADSELRPESRLRPAPGAGPASGRAGRRIGSLEVTQLPCSGCLMCSLACWRVCAPNPTPIPTQPPASAPPPPPPPPPAAPSVLLLVEEDQGGVRGGRALLHGRLHPPAAQVGLLPPVRKGGRRG
jgi:hypothetical protein